VIEIKRPGLYRPRAFSLHLQRMTTVLRRRTGFRGSVGLSCRYPARKSHCGCSFRVLVGLALYEESGKDSDLYHAKPGSSMADSIAYTRAKGSRREVSDEGSTVTYISSRMGGFHHDFFLGLAPDSLRQVGP